MCGRLPHDPVQPQRSPWTGTGGLGPVDCGRVQTIWGNVPHEHRACQMDADCVALSGDGDCFRATLNRRAATLSEYRQFPCGNPVSGACASAPQHAVCTAGCCELRPGP